MKEKDKTRKLKNIQRIRIKHQVIYFYSVLKSSENIKFIVNQLTYLLKKQLS